MNCKKVEELIPLHLSGDVSERNAQSIAVHLAGCAACAGLAEEYRSVYESTRSFEPPQFSEDFYAGIRQGVLRRIQDEPVRSSWYQGVALFQPTQSWALATALVLMISVSAIYLVRLRQNSRPSGPTNNGSIASAGNSGSPLITKESPGASEAATPNVSSSHSTTRKPRRSIHKPQPISLATVALHSAKGNMPGTEVISPRQTVKVEMQTADPNVRIIWFYNQPNHAVSPREISKGL